ncbi:hypothetical protein HS125_07475 [bacterium]|nr:hypothetical protein [bacterium]
MGRKIADRRVVSAAAARILDQSRYPYTRFTNTIHGWLQRQALPVRDAIVTEMNLGLAFLNWYGHAAPHVWSHERVFKATEQPDNDLRLVEFTGKLAFVTNFSCRSGWINLVERPFNICLAEDFMRHRGKGAIGVLAPSGATGTSYHEQICDRLMELLFQRGHHVLGPLVTQTKVEYHLESDSPSAVEVSDQFILVGDPMVKLALPERGVSLSCTPERFMPGSTRVVRVELAHSTIREGTASLLAVFHPLEPMWRCEGEPIVAGRAVFELPVPATQTAPIRLYGYLCNNLTRQESMGSMVLSPARTGWTWSAARRQGRNLLRLEPAVGTDATPIALSVNGARQPTGLLEATLPVADGAAAPVVIEALNEMHPVARWEGVLLPLPAPGEALLVAQVQVEPSPLSALVTRAVAATTLYNLSDAELEGLRVRWLAGEANLGEESVALRPGETRRLERILRPPFPEGALKVRVELLLP